MCVTWPDKVPPDMHCPATRGEVAHRFRGASRPAAPRAEWHAGSRPLRLGRQLPGRLTGKPALHGGSRDTREPGHPALGGGRGG